VQPETSVLTTKTKIMLAGITSRGIARARRVLGLQNEVAVRRGKLWWKLDLQEGIDFAIFLFGVFERQTVIACRRHLRPGDVAVDIGANIGSHTLHLARCVGPSGRVFAVEPTAFAYRKLLANVAMNQDLAARITAEQVMLVDARARELAPQLYSSWPLTNTAPVHSEHLGRLMDTAGARAVSLDEYLESVRVSSVALMKIDVDGHECSVLRGAIGAITRFRPVIVIEIAPYLLREVGHELGDLVQIMTSLGYELRDQVTETVLPNDAEGLRALIPEGAGVNVIALPR
jgi:FkbM family methyltransferase